MSTTLGEYLELRAAMIEGIKEKFGYRVSTYGETKVIVTDPTDDRVVAILDIRTSR